MKKIYSLLLFATLSVFNFLQGQSVTAGSTTPSILATYTFTYVNTNAIGSGTNAPNIFILDKPNGYPNFIAYGNAAAIAPYLSLEVNGNPVAINSSNFSIAGSWSSGIQLAASSSFQIPAGSTIKVIVSGVITNPSDTSGTYTFNWRTAGGGGGAIQSFSASVTFSNLSIDEGPKKQPVVISPNPAQDFTVLNGVKKGSKISVYDLSGKVLLSTIATESQFTINTTSFTKGVYIVKVDNQSVKLVVSK